MSTSQLRLAIYASAVLGTMTAGGTVLAQATLNLSRPVTSLTPQQTQWLNCIDPILDGVDQAGSIAHAAHQRVVAMAKSQLSDASIDAFLGDVLCLRAKMTHYFGDDWLDLIQEAFKEHLFARLEYKKFLIAEMRRLDQELLSIQEKTLVRLSLDLEYDPTSRIPKGIDLGAFDDAVNKAFENITDTVREATIHGMNGAVVGFAVGAVVQDKVEDRLRSEDGSSSWSGLLGSIAAGAAAESVSDAAIEQVTRNSRDTRASIRWELSVLVRRCTDLNQDATRQEVACFSNLINAHEADITRAVITYLGVNEAWARQQYERRKQARVESVNRGVHHNNEK